MRSMFLTALVAWGVAVSAGAQVADPAAIEAAIAANKDVKLDGDAAKGQEVYKMYCSLCHGDTGAGDGVGAAALDPKPRAFNDKAVMDTISDAQMVTVIKEGGAAVGKSMFMVSWKALLTEEQVKDVATFIRTLAK